MRQVKIRHQNVTKKVKEQDLLFDFIQKETIDMDGLDNVLQEDANIFLLNNLMMSVQFFENYERDVRRLRENWYKELPINSHHKKCFYADSLFRLSGENVKFSPRHGVNKNSESPLHPFRIYVSSDNVDAAFDPSAPERKADNVWPKYQFTVRREENSEKSGCISLVEFKTIHGPNQSESPLESDKPTHRNSIYIQNLDEKITRRFTKTELTVGFLNKDLTRKIYGPRCSMIFTSTADDTIPVNGFYKFESAEKRLKPKMIYDLRMYSTSALSHEIPQLCYQYEEVRNNSRRARLEVPFKTQRVLNSAAFKGYFCDLLIEQLAEPLNLDADAVAEGTAVDEFIIVNQKGVQYCIAPAITIRDRYDFVIPKRIPPKDNPEALTWPSPYMQKIMKILPCSVVPDCYSCPPTENLDYEKSWKIVFPKTEEFLLLHMMHAHIRCYFFVLLIYKSFIQPEINGASFGPKHLMHLLFWKVHKNFVAWPEDRPAETLLSYLKTLYKKLQNKYLPDFFITSRNLFANSHPKDLHKAQSLIKKIIENPVPYIIRAVSHLKLREGFYPPFDYSKLNKILTETTLHEKIKNKIKEETGKRVCSQVDGVQLRRKIINTTELEKKAEKQEETNLLEKMNKKIKEEMGKQVRSHIDGVQLRRKIINTTELEKQEETTPPEKIKKKIKEDTGKQVRFQDDEVQLRTKIIIETIAQEKKAEKQQEAARLSVQSVNLNEMLNFDSHDRDKCNQILQVFTSHFLQMGSKSMEYNFLLQAVMYLHQTQKLLELMATRDMGRENLKEVQQQLHHLKRSCYDKIKKELGKLPSEPKGKILAPSGKGVKILENPETSIKETDTARGVDQKDEETLYGDNDEDVTISVKL